MNISSRLIAPTASCAMMLLTGCVHVQSHPKSWEPPGNAGDPSDCPSITGSYDNYGTDPKGAPTNLAQLLSHSIKHDPSASRERNQLFRELGQVYRVDLKLTADGALSVKAVTGAGDRSWWFEKAKGQFKCHNGVLSLTQAGDGSGDNVAAFESSTLDLFLVGGDLVTHRHGGSAGVILLVPFVAYEGTWARFHKVSAASTP